MQENAFIIKDCALIAIATGEEAQNLRELRDRIHSTHPGSIYYHFWASLVRPGFDDPEYPNDFAVWAWRHLRDPRLAEQLSLIDPGDFDDIEDLRREVIEVIEARLDETEYIPWARTGERFHFVRSQIVVFDTGLRVTRLEELAKHIPSLSLSSIFYHFIDARRRMPMKKDDFSAWLSGFIEPEFEKYQEAARQLETIDPYFSTLSELRHEIASVCERYQEEL